MTSSPGREAITWPLHVLAAAAVLLPTALFGLGAWQSHAHLYGEAEQKVRHQTIVLGEHADKALESLVLVIEQTNQRIRGMSWEEIRSSRQLWDDLARLVQQVQQADAIFLVDPTGMNAFTTREFPSPRVDFSDRDYFIAQRDANAGVFLGGSYIGKISRRPIFNMSMRRETPSGGFDGVIGVSAYVDYFQRFYSAVALPGEEAVVALRRTDGAALVRYPPHPAPPSVRPAAFAEGAGAAAAGVFYTASEDGSGQRLVGFHRLREFPAFVSFGVGESPIRAAWHASLLHWGALAGLTAVALGFAASLAWRRGRREALAVAGWRDTYENLVREVARREQAETALLQNQKLEALGHLTGGVAHDFNNLLQILGGNLERMENLAADERLRGMVLASRRAVDRGEKLIQQLLAFARRQPLKFQVFDLNERLRGMIEMLRQAARGATVEFALADDLWPIEADAVQLELAILNLVVNARDAMPNGGGRITIATENRQLGEAGGELAGAFIAVTVSDDGAGMPREVLERVWEPFFTTKAAGKGTGLGLSMVYGFAKQSGGGVSIASDVGKGTAVTILLRKGSPTQGYAEPPIPRATVVSFGPRPG